MADVDETDENAQERTIHEPGRVDSVGTDVEPTGVRLRPNESDGQPFIPGSLFGRYEIIECIDKGGMGIVYRARHTALGKVVALKVVSTTLRFEPRAMQRFLREMQAIGRLEPHPHVLNAYDAGDEDGVQYIATEFVEGVQLGSLVDRVGPLSVSEACKIISQAASALEHLRKHNLVHRDIKPSNLMLTREGIVKVVDMGLALLRDEQVQQITSFGEAMGSVDYMAPEQWQDSHSVDWRSDVYSLGCTFYCLLAGGAPFSEHRRGSVAKLRAHLECEFPDIRKKRGDVPDDVAELLATMVTKDPENRLTELVQLSKQLDVIASGDLKGLVERGFAHGPIPLRRATTPNAFPVRQPKNEFVSADSSAETQTMGSLPPRDEPDQMQASTVRRIAIAVLVLGCLVGISALAYVNVSTRTDVSPNTLLSADPELMPEGSGLKTKSVTPSVATKSEPISLVGQQSNVLDIAFLEPPNRIASVSKEGLLSIFDLSSPEQPLHSVVVSESSADSIAFDSKSNRLAIASADGWLRIHLAQDGRELQTVVQQSAGLTSVVQIPGSNVFVTTDWFGDVRRIDISASPITNNLIAHRPDVVYDVDVSEDGLWMAWAGRDPTVTLLNVDTQELIDLAGHTKWVYDVAISPDGHRLATAGHEGIVKSWILPSGEPEHAISCVVPQALCFFPDSRHLAIGGRDATVKIWDLDRNQSILQIPVDSHIDSLAVSSDGKLLAIGANDGTLIVWPVSITPSL